MNKIFIGTLFTVALIIGGSANAKAQSKNTKKVITREAVNTKQSNSKVIETKQLNTKQEKLVPIKKTQKTEKKVKKDMSSEKMKKQPAKLNSNKG